MKCDHEILGRKLRKLRVSGNLKQRELAGLLNVSASAVSEYENGKSLPGYDVLCDYLRIFKADANWLMNTAADNDSILVSIDEADRRCVYYYQTLSDEMKGMIRQMANEKIGMNE